MLELLRKLIPSQYQDESEKQSMVRMLQSLLVIQVVASLAALILSMSGGWSYLYLPVVSMLILQGLSYLFMKRGVLLPAQLLLPATLYALLTYVLTSPEQYGLHDINVIGYAIIINVASLTLGLGGAFLFTLLIIIAIFGIGYGEMNGLIHNQTSSLTLPVSPIAISMIILVIAFIQRTLINRLNENVKRARENEKQQIEANRDLRDLQINLEARVDERTAELGERTLELEKISMHMKKRAEKLQAVAQVSRAITSIQNLNELLPQVTQVIGEQFGFYHVGIFSIDPAKEFAVLSASNSLGGQKMLERGHKLKIGEVGIVGNVAAMGKPRIALDTGADVTFFDNPDLPDTRSEMALPLKVGQDIIGVLDVQSEQPGAFTDEDIELLTIAADQVSIAIQNARRFEQTQQATAEAEALSRQYLVQEWRTVTEEGNISGYWFSGQGIKKLAAPVRTPLIVQAANSGRLSLKTEEEQTNLAIPIKLRGEVIGVMHLKSNNKRALGQDTVDISQAVADRVAIAIENARLLESSQAQASRERTIGEITSKIGASINLRNVLQTAVEELGRILPGSDVVIQLESGKNQEQ
jgi:GAF domain-containing protein